MIHGRGTGAVRKAVRDELATHPLVESTAPASHDGATLVRLALRLGLTSSTSRASGRR